MVRADENSESVAVDAAETTGRDRPKIDRDLIRRVIEQAHHEADDRRFGCDLCIHLGSDSDGGDYSPSFPVCESHREIERLQGFPFKVAPNCFELRHDFGAFGDLFYSEAAAFHRPPPAAFALIGNADPLGRIFRGPLTDELFEAIYSALADPIVWNMDAEEVTAESEPWRKMAGHVGPVWNSPKPIKGQWGKYSLEVVAEGDSLFDEKRDLLDINDAIEWAESKMREFAVRVVVAEFANGGSQ